MPFINHQSVVYGIEDYIQFYNYCLCHPTIGYLIPLVAQNDVDINTLTCKVLFRDTLLVELGKLKKVRFKVKKLPYRLLKKFSILVVMSSMRLILR